MFVLKTQNFSLKMYFDLKKKKSKVQVNKKPKDEGKEGRIW